MAKQPRRDTHSKIFQDSLNKRISSGNLTIDHTSKEYIISIDGHEFRSSDRFILVSIRNSLSKFCAKLKRKEIERENEEIKNRDNPARLNKIDEILDNNLRKKNPARGEAGRELIASNNNNNNNDSNNKLKVDNLNATMDNLNVILDKFINFK